MAEEAAVAAAAAVGLDTAAAAGEVAASDSAVDPAVASEVDWIASVTVSVVY